MQQLEKCPVCQVDSIRFDYTGMTSNAKIDTRTWDVWSCKSCGHGFINPQPSWEDLEPYYSSNYVAYDPLHGSVGDDEKTVSHALAEGKHRHVPLQPGTRLLDVGCGAGFFLRVAQKLGAIVQGVEPSAHGAKLARESGISVFHGNLEAYISSGEAGQFDVITANHVIEHVPNPVETLAMMKTLLAPGGYIWIAVPNAKYPLARKLKGLWHSTDLPWHLMQFSPESMALTGQRAGLKVRSQKTESIPRIVAGSLRLYLRYCWWLPRRLTLKIGLIDSRWAPGFARRMDQQCSGEAVITEFIAG